MEIKRIRLIRFTWYGQEKIPFIKITMKTENYKRSVGGAKFCLVTITYLALELPRKSVKHSSWKKLSYCFKL